MYRFDDSKVLKSAQHSNSGRIHPVVLTCYRFLIGLCIGGFNQYANTCIFLCFLQAFYIIYIVVVKPYITRVLLYRSIFNELVVLSIMIITSLYVHTYTGNYTTYDPPCMAEIFLIIISFLINVGCLIYVAFSKSPISVVASDINLANQSESSLKPALNESMQLESVNNSMFSSMIHPISLENTSATVIIGDTTAMSNEYSKSKTKRGRKKQESKRYQ
jgi:hypothetical protein